jgi:hypothetical protein
MHHFTTDWGFQRMFSALKFVLQFWKAFKRPFPKIAATRSTAGAAAFVPVHTLSAYMP